MKKILTLLLLLVIAFFVVSQWKSSQPTIDSKLERISVGKQELSVETAKTVGQITLGLGQRESLGSDGMLFVLPVRIIPTFWMKDMRFDLDFVWIDGTVVVDLTQNVSAQRGEADSQLKLYSPKVPVTHVLEMNAGEVQKRGIQIGDVVTIQK